MQLRVHCNISTLAKNDDHIAQLYLTLVIPVNITGAYVFHGNVCDFKHNRATLEEVAWHSSKAFLDVDC